MIADYLEALEGLLRFDRSLSRRVRREVEDHLREAVAADPMPDRAAAERRALAAFGRPEILAAEFAVVALARRTRRLGIAVILAVAGVLATMKARVAWYAMLSWNLSDEARALSGKVATIDRCAFWLAVVLAAAAVASTARRRIPAVLHAGYSRRLRGVARLYAAATGLLTLSVIGDGVLTALRLGMELRDGSAVPVASMAVEIACLGVAVTLLLGVMRRGASIEALLET
jgi:hypothetical protein